MIMSSSFSELKQTVLSAFGVGLLVLSLGALRNATNEEAAVEQALLTSLESTKFFDKVFEVLAMPLDLLIATKDAIVWLVTLPFRLVFRSFKSVEKAGTSTMTFITNCIQWILHLPSQLLHSFLGLLGTSYSKIACQISETSHATSEALSNSFLGVVIRSLIEASSKVVSNTASMLSSTQLAIQNCSEVADVYLKKVLEIVVQAYSRAMAVLSNATTNVQSCNQLIQGSVSWLQVVGRKTICDMSNGYEYLNELAALFAFYIEDIIASATGTPPRPGVRKYGGSRSGRDSR